MSAIHPTALVSPDASLDSTVTVGAYSIIEGKVTVGAGTSIGSHCVIKGETSIGERNRIFQFCSIGEDPQDKKYGGEPTRLVIGNDNTIREYCTLNRGTAQDQGVTVVGDNNWLMAYVHIAHDCVVGDNTIFANNVTLAGHVKVGDHVIFGGFAGAHQFARVGAYAFIANNTGVSRDVPPYVMAAGQPAVPRGINIEGLRRRGYSDSQTRGIKDAFKLLYRSGLGYEEAQAKIAELAKSHPELEVMTVFLAASERGIAR